MESTIPVANQPRTGGEQGGIAPATSANLLAELARAKVAFQLRTIEMVIRGGRPDAL